MRILKQYYFVLGIILLTSCGGDFNKRLDVVGIDEKWRNGELLEAKAEVITYLTKNEDNEVAWTLLGHIREDSDQDSLATIAYKRALDLNPKLVEAITGMGIVSRKMGAYEKAAEYYKQAIEIDPTYAQAYASLLVINVKRKEYQEAVRVGLKGYELDKEDPVIAANLSAAYHFINDTIQRDKYFTIAEKNGYRNIESLKMLYDGRMVFDDE